jgi:hypothetical protein
MTAAPSIAVPDDLRELDQWLLWRYEARNGRQTKVPCQVSGAPASSTDPATWTTYDKALAAWQQHPERFAGVGFVFTEEDGFTGIDFDDCLEGAKVKPWAQPLIERLADTYLEISPSGRGVKAWVKAHLSGSGVKRPYHGGAIEIYDRGRFFTVTGRTLNGSPLQIEEHQTFIDGLYRALAGDGDGKCKADIPRQKPIPEGKRHDYLVSVAAQLAARGMGLEEVFAATQAINGSRCKPPKPEPEIRGICKWVIDRERTRPRPRQNGPARVQSMSLEDLMDDSTIAVPELAIEGLLPKSGLVLFGGRPKDGKSWFACQMALSMATGQALGGWLKVIDPGRVHLWALEDQYAITKDKMLKLLHGTRPDGLSGIRILPELAQPILNGGDQIIRRELEQSPAELLILDSLFKLTGEKQPHSDISQRDYTVIDRVRKIALDFKCAAVIIMHTKKGAQGGNPIENLLGTSGTPAAADAVCELKRFRTGGKLTVTGRSVPMDDFELAWQGGPDRWGWTIQEQGEQAGIGETAEEVLSYLEAQGAAKPADIARAVHKSFRSVWSALGRLQDKGKAIRCAHKKWDISK